MNIVFIFASLASAILGGMFTILGGDPGTETLLTAEDLPVAVRFMGQYCWYVVTLLFTAMALVYGWAAFKPQTRELAMLVAALGTGLSAWNIKYTLRKQVGILTMPQWYLVLAINGIALLGF